MRELLMKIRRVRNITQLELAQYTGVSYATINRWENEHFIPKKRAQEKLFQYCIADDIPIARMANDKIADAVRTVSLAGRELLLYHGSRAGLVGEIAPISSPYSDFGAGFYMGEQPEDPLSLICDSPESKFYLVSVNLEGLKVAVIPDGVEWAMLVAFHRGKREERKGTSFYRGYQTFLGHYDMVIARTVTDRMFQLLDDFYCGNITDICLTKTMAALKPEKQYVAISEKACQAVKVEQEIPFFWLEKLCLREVAIQKRAEDASRLEELYQESQGKGKYFDEIIGKSRRE